MALVQTDFFSTSLMRAVTMSAVIPADRAFISADGCARAESLTEQRPFKTLYLLHGIYGNHIDWVTRTRIQYLAEARNLAVIMPSGDNSFYNDHASGARYGEFIGQELVEFTRKLFHLSCAREDTYVGGLSMGGYGAIVAGLRYPETFSHVVSLSAGLNLDEDRVQNSQYGAAGILGNRGYFESVYGPLDQVRGSVNDYDALAERLAAIGAVRPRIFMACGEQDRLLPANRVYRDHLQTLGYDLTYHEAPGTHNWKFWDAWIEEAINWLPVEGESAPISSGNVK